MVQQICSADFLQLAPSHVITPVPGGAPLLDALLLPDAPPLLPPLLLDALLLLLLLDALLLELLASPLLLLLLEDSIS